MATISIGFGREDITPEESVPLAGAGNTSQRMSQGVLHRIYSTCIAFSDECGETILLFSNDLLITKEEIVRETRALIHGKYGIPEHNILISATHSHSAPDQDNLAEPSIVRYDKKLPEWMLAAADEALADRRPAEAFAGRKEVRGLNFVRHYFTACGLPKGDNFGTDIDSPCVRHHHDADSEMRMIRFTREGARDIVLVNWQVHPHWSSSIKKGTHFMVSSDLVDVMRGRLEEKLGVNFCYFTGAAGNLNPFSRMPEEHIAHDYAEQGELLSAHAEALFGMLSPIRVDRISAETEILEKETNHSEDSKVADAEKVMEEWLRTNDLQQGFKTARKYGLNSPYHAGCILRNSRAPRSRTVETHTVSLGEFAFITAPYEMFDVNGVYIREHSPFAMTFVVCLANHSLSYVAAEYAYEINSYEANSCRFKKGTAEELADAYVAKLNDLYRK